MTVVTEVSAELTRISGNAGTSSRFGSGAISDTRPKYSAMSGAVESTAPAVTERLSSSAPAMPPSPASMPPRRSSAPPRRSSDGAR